MAKSKKVDESGLSNDTRSIYLERTEQVERDAESPGFDGPEWDYSVRGLYDTHYDYEPEDVKIEGKGNLTQNIEIPEHLRRLLNG